MSGLFVLGQGAVPRDVGLLVCYSNVKESSGSLCLVCSSHVEVSSLVM